MSKKNRKNAILWSKPREIVKDGIKIQCGVTGMKKAIVFTNEKPNRFVSLVLG